MRGEWQAWRSDDGPMIMTEAWQAGRSDQLLRNTRKAWQGSHGNQQHGVLGERERREIVVVRRGQPLTAATTAHSIQQLNVAGCVVDPTHFLPRPDL